MSQQFDDEFEDKKAVSRAMDERDAVVFPHLEVLASTLAITRNFDREAVMASVANWVGGERVARAMQSVFGEEDDG